MSRYDHKIETSLEGIEHLSKEKKETAKELKTLGKNIRLDFKSVPQGADDKPNFLIAASNKLRLASSS